MPATFDVAVIGGGVTGVSAALAARARGASTCLLRAAPGTTAMISGAWTGPLPETVRTAFAAAGYSLELAPDPLAHQRGDVVHADFAAVTHVRATPAAGTIVCGIAGLPHFNAPALARLWAADLALTSLTVELPGTPSGGWAPASLAAYIARDPLQLLGALGRVSAQHVILPAVLGVDDAAGVAQRLQQESGIRFNEALAVPPSLPGWRLQRAIERVLAAQQITCFTGRAALANQRAQRIEAVSIDGTVIAARAFILATGKFAAGGLTTGEDFEESVFGLPIWLQQLGDVYTAPDPLPLTDPLRSEPQPLLEAGVQTDEMMRPIDRSHAVVYGNVFAAGTIRAGWRAADSGLGHCAADGWNAGVKATT